MATPYSNRLLAGEGAASHTATVPAGYLAVLRDIEISSSTSNVISISFYIAGVTTWLNAEVPANGHYQWQGRVVLNPGESLGVACSVTGYGVVVSGYLLAAA